MVLKFFSWSNIFSLHEISREFFIMYNRLLLILVFASQSLWAQEPVVDDANHRRSMAELTLIGPLSSSVSFDEYSHRLHRFLCR